MIKNSLIFFAALILIYSSVHATESPVFATRGGAIRGYDPVAYFTEGKPVKGSDLQTFEWKGETFKFASAKHLAMFKAQPDKYAPQYGGYCAYAVSEGATASTKPEAWSIFDNKLYLNYSLNIRKLWSKNIPGRIADADKNWPGVLN